MTRPKIASTVRSLFTGTALATPPEDDAAADAAANVADDDKPKSANGPTEGQVTALVEAESAKAATEATTAANDRWKAVMTSDAGCANPKAAARLLSSTTMASEDIIETLDDLGGGTSAAAPKKDDKQGANATKRDADRQALDDANTDPNTGAAGGGPEARRGEGDRSALADRRKARNDRRNKTALASGGVQANT